MRSKKRHFSLSGAGRSTGAVAAAGVLALVLAPGVAGTAHATGTGGTYLQGAYADWEDADNGFNAGASVMLAPNVRAFGDYTDTDIQQVRAGGGLILPMPDPLSLEIGGSYQNVDFDGPGTDDDGVGIHGIARFSATPQFTLSGKVEHVFRDKLEDELVLGVDADIGITPQLSLFGSYETYDELDENLLLVGGRLKF